MSSLDPFPSLPSQLGVDSRFVNNETTVLVMQEHVSWSGGDYSVHTADGREVVRCSGQAVSLSSRKDFSTPQNEPLYTLRNENFSIPRSYYLEGPHGERFLSLTSHWNPFSSSKMEVSFRNMLGGGKEVALEIKGDFFSRDSDVLWDGKQVARVRRDFSSLRGVFGQGTYGVQVAGGVDVCLMSAIIIGLEEYRDAKRH